MQMRLTRTVFSPKSTRGELSVDGAFECFTLEDVVRPPNVKVKGATAIPAGTYQVIIDVSARFGRLMPHLLLVPNFSGVRIHAGNTDKDTEGCILVGRRHGDDWIGESRLAFDALYMKLADATHRSERIDIEIVTPPP